MQYCNNNLCSATVLQRLRNYGNTMKLIYNNAILQLCYTAVLQRWRDNGNTKKLIQQCDIPTIIYWNSATEMKKHRGNTTKSIQQWILQQCNKATVLQSLRKTQETQWNYNNHACNIATMLHYNSATEIKKHERNTMKLMQQYNAIPQPWNIATVLNSLRKTKKAQWNIAILQQCNGAIENKETKMNNTIMQYCNDETLQLSCSLKIKLGNKMKPAWSMMQHYNNTTLLRIRNWQRKVDIQVDILITKNQELQMFYLKHHV